MRAYKDPHGLYDAAREGDGIYFDAAGKCWIVTDHAAARRILSDPRYTSDLSFGDDGARRGGPTSFLQAAIQKQIIFSDGDRHRRVQQVILRESAHKMQEMLPSIRSTACRLLEAAKRRGGFDLIRDFAMPFSLETISLVVGVPTGDPQQVERLAQWSTTYANVTSGFLLVRMQEITALGDYFRELVATRRDARSDDLIGAFLREGVFEDEEDLVINCMMAFAAGRVTTQKLLGDGVPALLPGWGRWREESRRNPGLARRLTDELLRIVTPTRYLARCAMEDVDLSGELPGDHVIRRGEKVFLFLEAANRDPASFAHPHCMAPERQPNPHIAFGFGPHRCPGASIARVEIQIALEALLETFEELVPDPSAPPTWDPNPNLGGFASYRCLCS
ncbi:MAG TPA: cytochrome P450 [Longimicrobiaceae bacterium]|nr:cytochrome P450 [Longimicrobiaceae bacterium]